MTLSVEGARAALRRWGIGAHPLDWRLPPIETYPRIVAFAQTWPGRALLFAVFALLLKPHIGWWWEFTLAAALVSLAGRWRHPVLLLCTAAVIVRVPYWFSVNTVEAALLRDNPHATLRPAYLSAAMLVAGLALAALAIWLTRRHRDSAPARRPVLTQHLVFVLLLGLAATRLLHGWPQVLLWSLTATIAAFFWFLAYALMDQRQRNPSPLLTQLATFHPFFGQATSVPMSKGAGNWRGVEAGNDADLAVTQLKGLKLIVWALGLKVLLWLFRKIVYGKLGVVPLGTAFERFLLDETAPVRHGLASIVANFPEQLLIMAIWGHVIVAVARLAGFRLLRNTWRPLEARSIAEFWNRYFYYFKEILVHVYFYPTYLRWFKTRPKLRLAFATVVAAGFGNFFFHFILALPTVVRSGFWDALARMEVYAFYCALLAGGIVLSQLRARPARAGWWRGRLLPSIGVMAFYCFLSFFDGPQRHVTLAQHFEFLFRTFGAEPWTQPSG